MLYCDDIEEEPWLTLATWAEDHMQGTRITANYPCNNMVRVSKFSLKEMSAMGMQVTGWEF